jgi:hypothetical protein
MALMRRRAARARLAFIDVIPFLSAKERVILNYLRKKKQRTFVADHDGDYASTLLAKRYIPYMGVQGQSSTSVGSLWRKPNTSGVCL